MKLFRVHVRTPKGVRRFTLAQTNSIEAMKFVAKLMTGQKAIWGESFCEDLGELQGPQPSLFDTLS